MLIVATYTENMFPSVCVEAVEKLGNYWSELKSIKSYLPSNACVWFRV